MDVDLRAQTVKNKMAPRRDRAREKRGDRKEPSPVPAQGQTQGIPTWPRKARKTRKPRKSRKRTAGPWLQTWGIAYVDQKPGVSKGSEARRRGCNVVNKRIIHTARRGRFRACILPPRQEPQPRTI